MHTYQPTLALVGQTYDEQVGHLANPAAAAALVRLREHLGLAGDLNDLENDENHCRSFGLTGFFGSQDELLVRLTAFQAGLGGLPAAACEQATACLIKVYWHESAKLAPSFSHLLRALAYWVEIHFYPAELTERLAQWRREQCLLDPTLKL